jgi:hypothetical protein
VFVTAYPGDYPALTTKGYAAYHQKPVLPDALCRTIGDLLGRPYPRDGAPIGASPGPPSLPRKDGPTE